MSNIPYLEQLTDGEMLTPKKAKALALQVRALADGGSSSAPYKSYVAIVNQSGTNPPVATVLENTLGGTVVWTRTGNNMYYATLAGAFPQNKTVWNSGSLYCIATGGLIGNVYQYLWSSVNSFVAYGLGGADDGQLTNAMIEIKVYL